MQGRAFVAKIVACRGISTCLQEKGRWKGKQGAWLTPEGVKVEATSTAVDPSHVSGMLGSSKTWLCPSLTTAFCIRFWKKTDLQVILDILGL